MCKYFHSREAYLCQEAASCNVSSHRHCRNTFHGKPYILQYLPLHCVRLQACKGEARSEMQQKCLTDSWREKYNKINNPHKSQKVFTVVFFFQPFPPNFEREHKSFLSQALQSQAKCSASYCFQTRLHNVVIFSLPWPTWKFSAHSNILFKAWGITFSTFSFSWLNKT